MRDTGGSPFLNGEGTIRFALNIARRVIAAGALDRFRAFPVTIGRPSDLPD